MQKIRAFLETANPGSGVCREKLFLESESLFAVIYKEDL